MSDAVTDSAEQAQLNPIPLYASNGRPVLRRVLARYRHRAEHPGELEFEKGDVLLVLEPQNDGWSLCEIDTGEISVDGWWMCGANGSGNFGLAPDNFLVNVD